MKYEINISTQWITWFKKPQWETREPPTVKPASLTELWIYLSNLKIVMIIKFYEFIK